MKIARQGNHIRLQLMDMQTGTMLFDFMVQADVFEELKAHMIEHLNGFSVNDNPYEPMNYKDTPAHKKFEGVDPQW